MSSERVSAAADGVPAPGAEVGSVVDSGPELGSESVAGAAEAVDTTGTASGIAAAAGFEPSSLPSSAAPSAVDAGAGDGMSLGASSGGGASVAEEVKSALAAGSAGDARAESEGTSGMGHGWGTEPSAANAVGSMVGPAESIPSARAREGSASTARDRAVTAAGRRQPDLERKGEERYVSGRHCMCMERNTH